MKFYLDFVQLSHRDAIFSLMPAVYINTIEIEWDDLNTYELPLKLFSLKIKKLNNILAT